MTRFLATLALAAAAALAGPSAASARAQTLDRAEISGTIRDQTGGVLPGVSLTLRETQTGFERATMTNADGRYSAPLLPLGTYIVRADYFPEFVRINTP